MRAKPKNVKQILASYRRSKKWRETHRKTLGDEILIIETKHKILKEKHYKISGPYWGTYILEPLAKLICEKLPSLKTYEIFGPFGMSSRTSIYFYPEGLHEGNRHLSLHLRPGNLSEGKLLLETNEYMDRYGKGTLGEMNGGNIITVEMKPDLDWIINFMMENNVDAALGTSRPKTTKPKWPCGFCGGTGYDPGKINDGLCPDCEGAGV